MTLEFKNKVPLWLQQVCVRMCVVNRKVVECPLMEKLCSIVKLLDGVISSSFLKKILFITCCKYLYR